MDRPTALSRAGEWRERRAELLAALGHGGVALTDVLAARHQVPAWGEVKLLAVLEARPGARKVVTRRGLAALGLGERVRLRELDDAAVAAVLTEFGGST